MVGEGNWSDQELSGGSTKGNYLDKFLQVDPAVTIHISLVDHLIDLVVSHILTYGLGDACE